MATSFFLWVAFTLWLMFWGANTYFIFFGLVESAAKSSAVYWLVWLLVPLIVRAWRPDANVNEASN